MIPYIGPASKKQEMFLNSDADITLAGGAAGCFDKDTEYLSRTGWKKINTYSGEDIAQFDPITKDIQFITPLEYIKLPCSTLSRMSARGLDMCLSDEHRVPYWTVKDYSKLPNVISFGEVKNRHISSKTKGWTGNIGTVFKNSFEDADISDGEIRLQVAVQADGRVVKEGKDNYTQMRFGKERKYTRLISICKEYGLRYKDNGCKPCPKNSSGVEYEVIVWPSFPTKLFDDFWWTLSARQLKIVVEEVGHWDGTFVKNNDSVTIRYFTNKIQNADFIQYAFHSCGMNTSYVIDRDNVITVNATYSGKGFRCFANKDAKVNIENYKTLDGYKYCFSVPSTFLVVRRNNKIYISGNSGKALRHGEKVLTTNGFKNIEEIQVGEYIRTPKNTIEKVEGVFPQGVVDIYRVTFYDGTSIECCGDHLWEYSISKSGKSGLVSSTKELKNLIDRGNSVAVPLTNPVEISDNTYTLPIKPYTLGVLLGDGSMSTNSVSFITNDNEIYDNVKEDGHFLNQWQPNETRTTAKTYGVLGVQQALRNLNLLGTVSNNKFIPEVYKNSSVSDRFELIRGLMDTDGYVDDRGNTEFSTVSLQLSQDVRDILHSLGFTVTITTKIPTYTYNGEKRKGQKSYILYIRGYHRKELFKLTRKADRCKYRKFSNKIVSIEFVGRDEATCISVSGPDKLFITTNFIVTHNTYTSLLIALKYMQHPRATGIIFRRTSVMLTSPGSIWHEAVSLYSQIYPTGLKIRERKLEIVFPNGALLKFSHMQHATDMYDHKGGQYSLVIFDEATDFTEDMVVYLLSRMRNAYVDYKPKMFMMTNPHYDSFLRLWIQDYYLDARGIPIQERTGNKRWFFRQGNTMLWYNSKEEAVRVHGEGDDNGVSSFTFIGATCQDNPPLLKAQPGYITNLLNQPRVEMERLLLGSWFARVEAAGHWKREWVTEVDGPNPLAKQRVRAWDFAFTKPSESSPNPDYTRGVLISKDIHKVYTVENVVSMRDRVHEVEKLVFETAKRDGTGVVISIPKDPNAQAGAYARDLQRRLGERGYMVRLSPPVKSKLTRFAPFSSISQSGFVQVVKADWNKEYYEELEVFDGEGKSKDDQVDATSDCIALLNREIVLPNSMSLPNLSTNAPPTFNFNQGQNIISLPTFNI